MDCDQYGMAKVVKAEITEGTGKQANMKVLLDPGTPERRGVCAFDAIGVDGRGWRASHS